MDADISTEFTHEYIYLILCANCCMPEKIRISNDNIIRHEINEAWRGKGIMVVWWKCTTCLQVG